jgi:xylose isomerase
MQTLELAQTLQDTGYGEEGELIGFDLYPYTEDQVAAVRRAYRALGVHLGPREKDRPGALRRGEGGRRRPRGPEGRLRGAGLDEDYEAEVARHRGEAREARTERSQGNPGSEA